MATEQVKQINKLCAELQERANRRVAALIFQEHNGRLTGFLPAMSDADRKAALDRFEREIRADVLETSEQVRMLITASSV
jgi:hypothetical protein